MAAIRTFIAIHLTDEIRQEIERTIGFLSPRARGVRWVSPENLHLTLRFLGDVEEKRMPEVCEAVSTAAGEVPPFAIRVGDFGAFPGLDRPKVLWIGVEGDTVTLGELQRRVETELVRRGFPEEDRPFSPHLTVGRTVRDRRASVPVPPAAITPGPEMTVREVFVIKSDLRPEGPVYTPLLKAALKSA